MAKVLDHELLPVNYLHKTFIHTFGFGNGISKSCSETNLN